MQGELKVKSQLAPGRQLGAKSSRRRQTERGHSGPSAMGDGAAARISVAEMKSYYLFCEWCSWLLSVAEGECRRRAGTGPGVPGLLVVAREGVWDSSGTGLWAHGPPPTCPQMTLPWPEAHASPSEPRWQSGWTPSRAPGGEGAPQAQGAAKPEVARCLRARDGGSLVPLRFSCPVSRGWQSPRAKR